VAPADDFATSTIPEPPALRRLARARNIRRAFLTALFVLLSLGLAGRMGVRSAVVDATGGGYAMRVTYAAATRPGLDTPFTVELRHPGGFKGDVKLAVRTQYLDMFDKNGGLDPDPSESSSDDDFVYWTFDPPSGDVLRVSLDAIMAPGQQWGDRGVVRLMDGDRTVVAASFRTWVMP
jgi:hypothetical protein